jgi:hypothetical protein
LRAVVRPYVLPYSRVTLGHLGPTLHAASYPAFGIQGFVPGGTPTHWTPWTFTVARVLPLRRLGRYGPPTPTMSPMAYFTPPALWGIVNNLTFGWPILPKWPAAGRTETPPVLHQAINPFPGFRPPLPPVPMPASWRGMF